MAGQLEAARTGRGSIVLRDSGTPQYTVITSRAAFAAFLAAAKRGDLDHLAEASPGVCVHCGGEPPRGHTCPRCGTTTLESDPA